MTDEQITQALAEKVIDCEYDTWNPLVSDADACFILDAMDAKGWAVLLRSNKGEWECRFFRADEMVGGLLRPGAFAHHCNDRRRAICIATLKAVGAWEE